MCTRTGRSGAGATRAPEGEDDVKGQAGLVCKRNNLLLGPQYEDRRKTAQVLYDQYGKPLEAEHKGEYVVISNSGNTIVGKNLTEVVTDSIEKFGKGHFVFKIGSRAVGSFR